MQWHTPADDHWANNYAVTCHARIAGGAASVVYTAEHLPTRHQERSASRGDAVRRLKNWIAAQVPPKPAPPLDRDKARKKAVQERIHAIQCR